MPGPSTSPLRRVGAPGTVAFPAGLGVLGVLGVLLLTLLPALAPVAQGAVDGPGLLVLAVATLLLAACRTRPVVRPLVGGTAGVPALRRRPVPLAARVTDPVHHPRAARAPGTA